MFPFWDIAVAPVLEAAQAHQILEIGALRGENTRQMIDRLGPETVLHVIDPLPDFDPIEHEREFKGQYVFYQALSLDVLADVPPVDAALIDGDHNWYTVYNELRLLRETARRTGSMLPVMILHDVSWPYGKRDLYYDPDSVPAEHRKDWRRAGMVPGQIRLQPGSGGLNPGLANARVEGGPHNGIMTAVDDFIAEHDKPLRKVLLPIYFGLAIVVENERLEAQPELRAALDGLESAGTRYQLMKLAEELRLEALIHQHTLGGQRVDATALGRRYLRDVKKRILAGPSGDGPLVDMDPTELDALEEVLDTIRTEGVRGAHFLTGAGRGGEAVLMRAYLEAHLMKPYHLWVHDRFAESGATSLQSVDAALAAFDLLDDRIHTLPGDIAEELPEIWSEQIGIILFAQSPPDLVEPVLSNLYDRVAPGGFVMVSSHAPDGVLNAVTSFLENHAETVESQDSNPAGRWWRKPRTSQQVRAAAGVRAGLADPDPDTV